MKFEKLDQEVLKKTLLPQVNQTSRIIRIINNILLASIILLLSSIVLINIYLPEYGTTMYVICFGGVTVALLILIFGGMYRLRVIPLVKINNNWKKKIKQPDSFTINEDLSITINIDDSSYQLDSIVSFDYYPDTPYLLNIHGMLTKNNRVMSRQYELLAVMEEQETLNLFLQLNKDLYQMASYRNSTLEKIILMSAKERSRLFVNELMEAKLFIAVHYTENQKDACIYPYHQKILLSCYSEECKLCVFTSVDRITKEIKQKYPRGLLLTFKEIIDFLDEGESHVFKKEIGGIILNPQSDQLELGSSQLQTLQIIKEDNI